jgi:hypothetical protein
MPKQARVHVVSKSHILDAGRVYRTILSVCWNYISRNVVFVFMFIWNNVMGVHEVTTPVGTVLIQPRCTDVVGSRVVIFKCIKTVSTALYELSWQRCDVWVKQQNGKMILPPCCSSFGPFLKSVTNFFCTGKFVAWIFHATYNTQVPNPAQRMIASVHDEI